ncbi:MAG: endonuclease domain-containing protein [Acidovorax sp.]|nr:endonuclease domain-containing protein [Acidovorax sp.]
MDQRQFTKTLRQNMTDAEQLLWKQLRAHRMDGQKFRRQQPIGPYIVDFVHFGLRLIVEADGGQHVDSEHDAIRDAWLRSQGFTVLRFWNNDILQSTEAVLESIYTAMRGTAPSPPPSPPAGEGPGERGPHHDHNPFTKPIVPLPLTERDAMP